jgi:hypothetical protein
MGGKIVVGEKVCTEGKWMRRSIAASGESRFLGMVLTPLVELIMQLFYAYT